MSVAIKDIHWAAGLLEGEGCFYMNTKRKRFEVLCNMTDKEPLDKLASLFGGTIHSRPPANEKAKPYFRWEVYSSRAIGLMQTLHGLLSPRRQAKIREILEVWKSTKTGKHAHSRMN
jgi:hypothetical protein